MDEPLIIFTSKDSSIMAYGESRRLRVSPLLILILAAIFLMLVGWLTWLSLRPIFHIPDTTSLMLSVSPRTANQLMSAEIRDQLPATWRGALESDSRLPAILGLYHTDQGYRDFVLAPFWVADRLPGTKQDIWFLTLTGGDDSGAATKELRYTDSGGWFATNRWAKLGFLVFPDQLFPSAKNADTETPAFTATYDRGQVQTDVAAKTPADTNLNPQGDLFFAVPSNGTSLPVFGVLLNEIGFGNLVVSQLSPLPSAVALSLADDLKPVGTSLYFQDVLTRRQINQIMNGFNLAKKQPIKLPNGEVVIEQIPWFDQDISFPTSTLTKYGQLTIDHNSVGLSPVSSTDSGSQTISAPATNCAAEHTLSYLSPRLVRFLASELFHVELSTAPGVSIFANNSKIAVCLN